MTFALEKERENFYKNHELCKCNKEKRRKWKTLLHWENSDVCGKMLVRRCSCGMRDVIYMWKILFCSTIIKVIENFLIYSKYLAIL